MSDGVGGKPVGLAARIDEWMLALDRWRARPVAVASAVVVGCVVAGVGWWMGRGPTPPPVEDLIPQIRVATTETTTAGPVPVVVHVAGAVVTPGVYVLDDHSRVTDAIATQYAAGQLTITEIARTQGCDPTTVHDIARSRGLYRTTISSAGQTSR